MVGMASAGVNGLGPSVGNGDGTLSTTVDAFGWRGVAASIACAGSCQVAAAAAGERTVVAVIHEVRVALDGVDCQRVVAAAKTPIATKFNATAAPTHAANDRRPAWRRRVVGAPVTPSVANGSGEGSKAMLMGWWCEVRRAQRAYPTRAEFIDATVTTGDRQDRRWPQSDRRWFAAIIGLSFPNDEWTPPMARMPRLAVAGQPHLVVQRGGSVWPVFIDDTDRRTYLAALGELAQGGPVAVHAYALLDDAVMLLATPREPADLSRFMQRVSRRYVPAFHRRHGGSGPLWAGRFQAAALEPERYLLPCTLLIEQTPVRSGVAALPTEWPWSSTAHHVGRANVPWLQDHAAWWRLGNTPFEREARYEAELQHMLASERVAELLAAARGGWPLGSQSFVAAAALVSERPVRARPRGRPRRETSIR